MHDEAGSTEAFYEARTGAGTVRVIARHLMAAWPDLTGQALLGLGYTSPFLDLWRGQTVLTAEGRFRSADEAAPPGKSRVATCLVDEMALPFPDLSFDRILMIHALETAASIRTVLRNVWKILKDDGKLILIVPNRRGIWAFNEGTPFGQGTPFSQRQVRKRLNEAFFHVERSRTALYPPPFPPLYRPKVEMILERAGSTVLPACGGVVIVEAVKSLWGGTPLPSKNGRPVLRRHVLEA